MDGEEERLKKSKEGFAAGDEVGRRGLGVGLCPKMACPANLLGCGAIVPPARCLAWKQSPLGHLRAKSPREMDQSSISKFARGSRRESLDELVRYRKKCKRKGWDR